MIANLAFATMIVCIYVSAIDIQLHDPQKPADTAETQSHLYTCTHIHMHTISRGSTLLDKKTLAVDVMESSDSDHIL